MGDDHSPFYFGASVTVKIISIVKYYNFIVTPSEVYVYSKMCLIKVLNKSDGSYDDIHLRIMA